MSDATKTFTATLVAARKKAKLDVAQIATRTKISLHCLNALESGDFDSLPAVVFVRGFIKSYAQATNADANKLLTLYEEAQGTHSPGTHSLGAQSKSPKVTNPRAASNTDQLEGQSEEHIFGHLSSPVPRRGGVTLAVVILVIVATLTMSYLLKRPSGAEGDGVTRKSAPASPSDFTGSYGACSQTTWLG